MASNDYAFVTRWRVRGDIAAIHRLIGDAREYPRWWPDVYLEVHQDKDADAEGLGASGTLLTKGWLPYRLRWRYTTIANTFPTGFAIKATGDFVGRGIWTFLQDGEWADIRFDWTLRAEKPLLKYLSFIFKPFFRANHAWAMRRGLESVVRELARLEHGKPPAA